MNLLLLAMVALSITMVLIPPLERLAGRLNILDQPSGRKVHAQPVPRVGGIAMVVGTLVPLAVWLHLTPQFIAFLSAGLVILVFGVLDDRLNLSWRMKVLGQLLAIGLIVGYGDIRIESVTFDLREPLPQIVSWPLTVFFLLGVTNAINLADGLDGLAGGTTLLCVCAIGLLALSGQDPMLVAVVAAIGGAILGFLRFNTYPARVFMGDAGSQFLGLSAGTLAIMVTQNPNIPVSAALPLLLLGLPILDTLMVMVQRIAAGRSPFSADRNHIHHRLLALGFDHHEAVIAIYLLQGLLFLCGYFLRYESDALILAAFAGFAASVIGLLQWAERAGWRWRQVREQAVPSNLARRIRWLRAPERLPRWTLLFIGCAVPAYALYVILRSAAISEDLSWLALGLFVVTLLSISWRRGRDMTWMDKGAMYVAAVLVVYLDQTAGPAAGNLASSPYSLLPFVVLAVAVVLHFRLSNERRFTVTPLDVLVIFIALVVPNLPGTLALPPGTAVGVAKVIVLLYALEMVLAARLRWEVPRAVLALALGLLVMRGLLSIG